MGRKGGASAFEKRLPPSAFRVRRTTTIDVMMNMHTIKSWLMWKRRAERASPYIIAHAYTTRTQAKAARQRKQQEQEQGKRRRQLQQHQRRAHPGNQGFVGGLPAVADPAHLIDPECVTLPYICRNLSHSCMAD